MAKIKKTKSSSSIIAVAIHEDFQTSSGTGGRAAAVYPMEPQPLQAETGKDEGGPVFVSLNSSE